MAWMMHRWASGQRLEAVLRGGDMAAGDFVRRCKQVVDLVDQIGDAAPEPTLRATARKAVDAVMRGWWPPTASTDGRRRHALRRCRGQSGRV